MNMEKPKIVIVVQGGYVAYTAANTDIDVIIVDFDNAKQDPAAELLQIESPEFISPALHEAFKDANDVGQMEIREALIKNNL